MIRFEAVRERVMNLVPARFRRDQRGVAAVEFALILPVMVLLYVGVVDLTYAVTANRKVAQVTSAVADLTAQAGMIDDTGIAAIFSASADIMRPMPGVGLAIAITSIDFDTQNPPRARVGWSDARGRAPRTEPPTLPAGMALANSSIVFVEVSYNFRTPARFFLPNGETYTSQFFLRPRVGSTVQRVRG